MQNSRAASSAYTRKDFASVTGKRLFAKKISSGDCKMDPGGLPHIK